MFTRLIFRIVYGNDSSKLLFTRTISLLRRMNWIVMKNFIAYTVRFNSPSWCSITHLICFYLYVRAYDFLPLIPGKAEHRNKLLQILVHGNVFRIFNIVNVNMYVKRNGLYEWIYSIYFEYMRMLMNGNFMSTVSQCTYIDELTQLSILSTKMDSS